MICISVYLKDRVTQRARTGVRVKESFICRFIPQMAAKVKAALEESQKLGTPSRSLTWMQGPKHLGPSSAAFPEALTGSWITSDSQDSKQHSHGMSVSQAVVNVLCHSRQPLFLSLLFRIHLSICKPERERERNRWKEENGAFCRWCSVWSSTALMSEGVIENFIAIECIC